MEICSLYSGTKCHFDDIFITACTESCQNDNFRCSQWWKFRQNDDILVVKMTTFGAGSDENFVKMTTFLYRCTTRNPQTYLECRSNIIRRIADLLSLANCIWRAGRGWLLIAVELTRLVEFLNRPRVAPYIRTGRLQRNVSWFSTIRWYLQCVSNWDTIVLNQAIELEILGGTLNYLR